MSRVSTHTEIQEKNQNFIFFFILLPIYQYLYISDTYFYIFEFL